MAFDLIIIQVLFVNAGESHIFEYGLSVYLNYNQLIILFFSTEKNLNTLRHLYFITKRVTRKIKLSYNYKIWLEHDKKPLLGKGRYELLKYINKTNSLKLSAKKVGISNKIYRQGKLQNLFIIVILQD